MRSDHEINFLAVNSHRPASQILSVLTENEDPLQTF